MTATATKADKSVGPSVGKDTMSPHQSQSQAEQGKEPERGQANGQSRRRPEKEFRIGSCRATIWCNEHKVKSGPNQQTTRIFRSINFDRTFWNEKLKDGKGDWDSTYSFGLGDVHNLIRVAELATEYVEKREADVTRDA